MFVFYYDVQENVDSTFLDRKKNVLRHLDQSLCTDNKLNYQLLTRRPIEIK